MFAHHLVISACLFVASPNAADAQLTPRIDGNWWTVAENPDLGKLATAKQQPVDFAVWKAADGTWQLWSCIRNTGCGGKTRLLYGWEGRRLSDERWKPLGIALQADEKYGEEPGGLQAPFVLRVGEQFHLAYGNWHGICAATSRDGKTFTRLLNAQGKSQQFAEGVTDANTRDPMILKIGDTYYVYYTAHPNRYGAVYCRTSRDLRTYSDAKKVAAGGKAGDGPFSAECPFVAMRNGQYFLFRTQRYGRNAQTMVYRSNDPLDFGIDDDRYLIDTLAIAAPEIVSVDGQDYVAALRPALDGVQIAKLSWEKQAAASGNDR